MISTPWKITNPLTEEVFVPSLQKLHDEDGNWERIGDTNTLTNKGNYEVKYLKENINNGKYDL